MAAAIPIIIAVAGAAMEAQQKQSEANAKTGLLELQKKQAEIQATDQANQELDKTEKILSAQRAKAGASGTAPSSGSLFAIQRDTFNTLASDQEARQANLDAYTAQIDAQEEALRQQSMFGIAGAGLDIGKSLFKFKSLSGDSSGSST